MTYRDRREARPSLTDLSLARVRLANAISGAGDLNEAAEAVESLLAGYLAAWLPARFGQLDADGHLINSDNHEMWHVAAYLPRGRESEVAEFLTVNGIEVYRMWQEVAR